MCTLVQAQFAAGTNTKGNAPFSSSAAAMSAGIFGLDQWPELPTAH